METFAVFWFRRDLRIEDNKGFFYALTSGLAVKPIFIFDTNILDRLSDKTDARVTFIQEHLQKIQTQLQHQGSGIEIHIGNPIEVWEKLFATQAISEVYFNEDYEPAALERDKEIMALGTKSNVKFYSFTDHIIRKPGEVLSKTNSPYTIYSFYKKEWRSILSKTDYKPYKSEEFLSNSLKFNSKTIELDQIGFKKSTVKIESIQFNDKIVSEYNQKRDFPAENATSHLGIHLRFGTISIRKLVREAIELEETFVNELIWREFFIQLLYFFPETEEHPFQQKFKNITWLHNESMFAAWCEGKTGYPLVDAGMRQLNETGQMHNRVRMVVASFLTKHLLIDWKWGERYFASKLLDYELASNVGNWQWAASIGSDPVPYFRVFNPTLQLQKFDKHLIYCKKWIPELLSGNYMQPIVNHEKARDRVLSHFKNHLLK